MTRHHRPAPDLTAFAAAMREWEVYQQWFSTEMIKPEPDRQKIAEVLQLRQQAERKALRLESWREVRR